MNPSKYESMKNDPSFMMELASREESAVKRGDVVGMYEVLDVSVALDLGAERLDRIYTAILEKVFDILSQKLADQEFFNLADKNDLYTVRGIYEHGIERWSSGDLKGAKEIFLVLHHMARDEMLSAAMMPHIAAAASGMSLDDFIDELVDVQNPNDSETYAFFLTNFRPSVEGFLKEKATALNEALAELEKLKR